GEQRIAQTPTHEGTGLALQRRQNMPKVNDLASPQSTRSAQHAGAAEHRLDPLRIDADLEAMTDQPRRRGVHYAAHPNHRELRDPCIDLLVLIGAPRRQRLQARPFDGGGFSNAAVRAGRYLGEELAVRLKRVEVAATAQQQCRSIKCLSVAWRASIEPFSWLAPRLLREGTIR